jgi:hypothetical protein
MIFVVGDEGIGVSRDRGARAVDLAEASMEEDKVLINFLKHASLCEDFALVLGDGCFVIDVCFLRSLFPCRRIWWLRGLQNLCNRGASLNWRERTPS